MSELLEVLKPFGFTPHDISLFEMAFTHSSANGNKGLAHNSFDYERLEFLGDSLIGLVVSELVYKEHPELEQGGLSVLKAQFIRTESEASYALRYHFDKAIVVGSSFQGQVKDSLPLLEDVFESFIGALFLDQGLDFSYALVKSIFEKDIKDAHIDPLDNPKSELQEAMQADHKESVHYVTLSETGPAHDKRFLVGVYFEDEELGRGNGRSKKEAETEAARSALAKLAKTKKEG